MNKLLWVVQVLLAIQFLIVGVMHFIVPPGLPEMMSWMYGLSPELHYISGAAEILAALGLILPGLTGIQTRLTPLAALGLVVVVALAMAWHATRGEYANLANNAVPLAMAAFVAYGRWKLRPLKEKAAA